MPEYWIVGWERFCEREETGDWKFTCTDMEVNQPPEIKTLIKEMEPNGEEWTEYFPTYVFEQGSGDLLTVLRDLNRVMNEDAGELRLRTLLSKVTGAAYEAGRQRIVSPPPENI